MKNIKCIIIIILLIVMMSLITACNSAVGKRLNIEDKCNDISYNPYISRYTNDRDELITLFGEHALYPDEGWGNMYTIEYAAEDYDKRKYNEFDPYIHYYGVYHQGNHLICFRHDAYYYEYHNNLLDTNNPEDNQVYFVRYTLNGIDLILSACEDNRVHCYFQFNELYYGLTVVDEEYNVDNIETSRAVAFVEMLFNDYYTRN